MIDTAWRDLNATQRDILVALALDPGQTGVGINDSLGRERRNHATVQKNLASLREFGFVESAETDLPGQTKHHRLTDAGVTLVDGNIVAVARAIEGDA